MATAMFGAGCFWGVEVLFQEVDGVISTEVGYAGGHLEAPSYEDICTDQTGHAEVVRIEFDAGVVSYDALLDVFWSNHNPTTLNRQGPDTGKQYRSVIFTFDDEQAEAATRSKDQLDASGKWPAPVVTIIEPASNYFPAEDYHQQYLAKKGLSSCHI